MADDARIQLRPHQEDGRGLWLWVILIVAVIVGVAFLLLH
jgi:hypothetical protein